ncbi:MAG: helix-turn-helix domain-containing protein [Treponema sp.]|nr:helix-turn-helix domain-containing protein [Treponema sp.]
MSKLNIIQKREIEPLMLKASKIAKFYEKAANSSASVAGAGTVNPDSICKRCKEKECSLIHSEAVDKARELGGSYIYLCPKSLVFWTSPFYSGERFAGSLFSGGFKKTEKNSLRVKSLAQIMLLCADQITKASIIQKNVVFYPEYSDVKKNKTEQKCEQPVTNITSESNTSTFDMERMLIASLRRGDNIDAKKILVNLLKILYFIVKGSFPVFRLKAMELAVLLSRASADPHYIKDNSSLETMNHCIKKIEESGSLEEITEILCSITERMSGKIFSFSGVRHFSALRKAERYIWTNYTRKLSLKEIANASGLSAPYFSTVFKEEMGENLSNYLNRLRVEKAAAMLVTTNQPISEIASKCGFEDQSWFSKIFKNNTGLTPGKYRENGITAEGSILG